MEERLVEQAQSPTKQGGLYSWFQWSRELLVGIWPREGRRLFFGPGLVVKRATGCFSGGLAAV
jgi:hypothetical protein